ncbi:MAG: hypothetical protein QNJ85_14480 [Gammaproteobacteria bacterium]|nr:hypothetical protein [Gammaproteobacteria bacterium]
MNTPAHAMVNLVLLARAPGHRKTGAIVLGALVPDLVIILFYAWHLLRGTSERQIWAIEYYRPWWQNWIDTFNSIPLIALATLLCWQARRPLLLAFCASMLLHALGDLPLHHDDGHRHFFPFSEWRFESPVSYWDPAHHGLEASIVEMIAVVTAGAWLYRHDPVFRPWVLAGLAVYAGYWCYVALVWL